MSDIKRVKMLRWCRGCGVVLPQSRQAFCERCRPSGWSGGRRDDVSPFAQMKYCQLCRRRLRTGDGTAPAAADETARKPEGNPSTSLTAGPPLLDRGGLDGTPPALRATSPITSDRGGLDGIRFCAECRPVYQAAVLRRFQETGRVPREGEFVGSDVERLRARLRRRTVISGDRIAELAEVYDVPYNSYGRLRAYIEEFDQLPPERFLRARREHPVVETLHEIERDWTR